MMKRRAFTLVEIMIVTLIIGILTSIAVPNFIAARGRSQQKTCLVNMRQINNAKELLAMEKKLADGTPVVQADLWPSYIRGNNFPACPAGGDYTIGNIGEAATCSLAGAQWPHILNE